MLHFVRRHSRSWVVWVFVVAIIAVFGLWGVSAVVGDPSGLTTVATVDETAIDLKALAIAEANLNERYRSMYKENFTPQLRQQLNLRQQALDGLIERRVLLSEADRQGLLISDQELRDVVISDPTFQVDGRFSKERYLRMLRYSRMTPIDYEAGLREDLAIRRLQGLVEDSASVSDAEVRADIEGREERVKVSFVRFPASEKTMAVEITDADLQAYYDKQKASYQQPERVRVQILDYSPTLFEKGIEPTPEAVAERYEKDKAAKYTQQHEVKASHILVRVAEGASDDEKAAARKKIDEVRAKVVAGGDFAAIAKESSQDPGSAAKGGDLGYFGKGRMVPAFEEAVFKLKPGELSEVVQTPFGLHIIRVDDVREERVKPLDEVREQVVASLRSEEATKRAGDAAREDQAALTGGATLEEIATKRGIALASPDPFAKNATVPGLGRSPELSEALWKIEPGKVTEPLQVGRSWVIARLQEKLPAGTPELGAVRDRVETQYRLEKAREIIQKDAEALIAQAKEKGSLAAAAEGSGRKVEQSEEAARSGLYVPGIGGNQQMKDEIFFKLDEKNKLGSKPFMVAGDAFVVELLERTPADPKKVDEQLEATRKRLVQAQQQELAQRYLEELKARARIQVDQARLDSLPNA